MENPVYAAQFLFCKLDYFHFELCCKLLQFPKLHRKICQNRYRFKAKLNTGKCEVDQYPHTRGYVANRTAGSRWKSHIPEGQKTRRNANFCNRNGLPCGLAKMLKWRLKIMGKTLKRVEKLECEKYASEYGTKHSICHVKYKFLIKYLRKYLKHSGIRLLVFLFLKIH
jgi:hypothetical protein